MIKYSIGLDFGTNSCRSVIVSLKNGEIIAEHVYNYPSGNHGVLLDSKNPHVARQNSGDYIIGIEKIISGAIKKACSSVKNFSCENIISIGVDTTGSSPIPVDQNGIPLSMNKKFSDNLNAFVWLWKDHTSHEEAGKITEIAGKIRPQYTARCGGIYSSEWFWAKILHLKNIDRKVFESAYSFVELCDYIPALLSGNTQPDKIKRSICAAGHKAMFNQEWGGLPDKEFLKTIDPSLAELRDRLYTEAYTSDKLAGYLSPEWAKKLKLSTNIAIAVGAFDCHMGFVGAGGREHSLVKILGTSTCDIMIKNNKSHIGDIPGVCGIVNGSVIPGYYGIEAGQSAVGDIFLWFVNNLYCCRYGKTLDEKFASLEKEIKKLKPGSTGLLALDWNNGNRTILVDVKLTGLILGQTLHTKPHEIYKALVEATAFGALTIIERVREYGVKIDEVINCGGLAVKSPALMQIYADIIGMPMKISNIAQSCAFGAAIFGAVAAGRKAGGFDSVKTAQDKLCPSSYKIYYPDKNNQKIYKRLYSLYKQLHDGFGTKNCSISMYNVMKDLLEIC